MQDKVLKEGLTYDDVLVIPEYSEFLPSEVNTHTYFSRNIKLNIPIVTAAMDTVTEAEMAIAIAQEGGIGVLHKNMTIDQQAIQVRKVKRSESGMIQDPIVLNISSCIGDAVQMMKEHKIGGIPIVDDKELLLGIVTNRDITLNKSFSVSNPLSTRSLIP